RGEPDWKALPKVLPSGVESLIRRCLDRDRRTRVGDISVVRFVLDDPRSIATATTPAAGAPGPHVSRVRIVLPWAIAAPAIAALAYTIAFGVPRKATPSSMLRLQTNIGADVSLVASLGASEVLS